MDNLRIVSIPLHNEEREDQRHQQTFSLIVQEAIDFGHGTVEGDDGELVVGNIHDQVLAHHGQTDETEVTTGIDPRWSADIDAGKTCAGVSQIAINIAPSGKNDSGCGLIAQDGTLRVSECGGRRGIRRSGAIAGGNSNLHCFFRHLGRLRRGMVGKCSVG